MDWTPQRLTNECEAADKLRDRIAESLDRRLERYYGQDYGYSTGEYWPENDYYTWAAYILPQIIFQNPRVKVGSLKISEVADQARALELAINRWIEDTDHRQVLRRLGFDMGFLYGVSFTTPVPYGSGGTDKEDIPWRPQVTRVNPRLFSMDPYAESIADARFVQHITIDDRDNLLARAKQFPDEGWDKKLIESIGSADRYELTKVRSKDTPERNEIAYREVWVPEENTEDGEDFHGTIFTLPLHASSARDPAWLRPPRAFFGPRWGPYTIFGAHHVPGCPYPLAPLVAAGAQLEELNALALANYKAARRRKKIGLYDEVMTDTAQRIAKVEDGGTVGVPGFKRELFVETELGGVTAAGLAQEEHARTMADRIIGIADVQRGATTGAPLATEIMQAVGASNVRTADLAEQFAAAVRRQVTTVAWYMWKYDKVSQPLSQEDAAQLGLPPGVNVRWAGGDNPGSFDSLELQIEPYSMKRSDEPFMQQRAMQAIDLASNLAPAIVQNPHIRWKVLLERLGDAMNWPDYADILDENVAAQMTAMLMQAGQAGPQQAKPQPRMARDISPPAQGFPKPSRNGNGSKQKLPSLE